MNHFSSLGSPAVPDASDVCRKPILSPVAPRYEVGHAYCRATRLEVYRAVRTRVETMQQRSERATLRAARLLAASRRLLSGLPP